MLIIKIDCSLYRGLVTKQNQISQNIYTTAQCPIHLQQKLTAIGLIGYKQSMRTKYDTSLSKRLIESSRIPRVIQENLQLTSLPYSPD